MGRIPSVLTAVVAALAFSASAVATATATEKTKVLPEPTISAPTSLTVSAKGGKLVASNGEAVECTSTAGKSAFTSANLGTGKLELSGCKGPLSSTCTGEGDRSGIVLTEGTVHYELALEMTSGAETTLVGAVVILQREFHITCEVVGVKELVLARGCDAGKDDSAQKLTKSVLVLFKQWATGETKILEILPPEATRFSLCLLEASVNGKGFTLAALEGESTAEKWTQGSKEVEVLLMNPAGAAPVRPPRVSLVNFTENTLPRIDTQPNLFEPSVPVSIDEWEGRDEIEWKASRGTVRKNWPVVYVQGTTILRLLAQFELEAESKRFIEERLEGPVTITGELNLGGAVIRFRKELSQRAIKEQAELKAFIEAAEMETVGALPREVKIYERASIRWQWEGIETGGLAFRQSLGESQHNIITTFAALRTLGVRTTEVFFTLLYLTVKGISEKRPAPSEEEVIQGDWTPFRGKAMHAINYNMETGAIESSATKVLRYYESVTAETLERELARLPRCTNITVEALVEKREGQCGAWARAFSYTLAYEGVASTIYEIAPRFGGAAECETSINCELLVKTWLFRGPSGAGAFPYFTREIEDLEGIEGQDTRNPYSVFVRHYVNKVRGREETLYDPSYGGGPVEAATQRGVFLKYQEENIAGYCREGAPVTCQIAEASPQREKILGTSIEPF